MRCQIVLVRPRVFGGKIRDPGAVLLEGATPEWCTAAMLPKIAAAIARGEAEIRPVKKSAKSARRQSETAEVAASA